MPLAGAQRARGSARRRSARARAAGRPTPVSRDLLVRGPRAATARSEKHRAAVEATPRAAALYRSRSRGVAAAPRWGRRSHGAAPSGRIGRHTPSTRHAPITIERRRVLHRGRRIAPRPIAARRAEPGTLGVLALARRWIRRAQRRLAPPPIPVGSASGVVGDVGSAPRVGPTVGAPPRRERALRPVAHDAHRMARDLLDEAPLGRAHHVIVPAREDGRRKELSPDERRAKPWCAEVVVVDEHVVVEARIPERGERRPPDVAAVRDPAHPGGTPDGSRYPHPAAGRKVRPATVVERPAPWLVGYPRPAVRRPDPLAVGVGLPSRGHARQPVATVAEIGLPGAIGGECLLVAAGRGHRVARIVVGILSLRDVQRAGDRRTYEEGGKGDPGAHVSCNTRPARALRPPRPARALPPPRPLASRPAPRRGSPRRSATACRAPCPSRDRRCRSDS